MNALFCSFNLFFFFFLVSVLLKSYNVFVAFIYNIWQCIIDSCTLYFFISKEKAVNSWRSNGSGKNIYILYMPFITIAIWCDIYIYGESMYCTVPPPNPSIRTRKNWYYVCVCVWRASGGGVLERTLFPLGTVGGWRSVYTEIEYLPWTWTRTWTSISGIPLPGPVPPHTVCAYRVVV